MVDHQYITAAVAHNPLQLTDADLLPLEWRKATNSHGYRNMKEYRTKEVEATSWAKHGGPGGLKAAYVCSFIIHEPRRDLIRSTGNQRPKRRGTLTTMHRRSSKPSSQ